MTAEPVYLKRDRSGAPRHTVCDSCTDAFNEEGMGGVIDPDVAADMGADIADHDCDDERCPCSCRRGLVL